MPRESTEAKRQRILDAAEDLFAERGYFGVSVRDITAHLNMRLAAVNYHFESKENLFSEVIRRRIEPLSKARLERLKALDPDPRDLEAGITAMVRAFVEPMVEFCLGPDPGWRNYCRLIAQIAAQQYWSQSGLLVEYDRVASEIIKSFKALSPDASDFQCQVAFQMVLANTLYLMSDNARLDRLSGGRFRSADFEALVEPYVTYVSAGVVAVLRDG